MTRVRPSLVLVGALLVALGACADAAPDGAAATQTDADAVRVVVTTAVLGDVVTQVLDGTGAEIEVVMPSGVDPHAYEPSASDGLALREADLVVANGLQLETSLLDVLDAAADDGVTVLEVGEQLDTLLEIGAEARALKRSRAVAARATRPRSTVRAARTPITSRRRRRRR